RGRHRSRTEPRRTSGAQPWSDSAIRHLRGIAPARPTSHRPDRHRTGPTDIAPARPTSHRPDRHRTGPIDGSHGRADCRAHTGPIVTAEYRTRAEASAQTMMTNANSVSQAPAGSREPCARI